MQKPPSAPSPYANWRELYQAALLETDRRRLSERIAVAERALVARGVAHDVKEYADARHSFLNEHDRADTSILFRILGTLTGLGYHEPSARDARARIVEFFRTHLGERPIDVGSSGEDPAWESSPPTPRVTGDGGPRTR